MAYGVGAVGSSQRDKSAVTLVPTVGGVGAGSMTSSAQIAATRTTSLPKTPAMSGVGSPASVGNMSGPFNATSPYVEKEADKTMREKFSKIEMLTIKSTKGTRNGFSLVLKSRTRIILLEKRDDGTVAMHYGEHNECDYLELEECLPY
ncbi:hypothetical protein Tco_0347749 [Tanacetum coccineum]